MQVNHAYVPIFNVPNMSFNAYRENKIRENFRIYSIPTSDFQPVKMCIFMIKMES